MKNNQYNNELDKLFQEKLSNRTPSYSQEEMEADWNNIQQQLPNQGGATGGHGSGGSAFSAMKGWMMATGAAIIVAGGITYYSLNSGSEQGNAPNQQEQVQQNSQDPAAPSNQGSNNSTENAKTPSNSDNSSIEPGSSLDAPDSEANPSNEQASKITSDNGSATSNNNPGEPIESNQGPRGEVASDDNETQTSSEKDGPVTQNTNSSSAMQETQDSKRAMFPEVIFSDEQQTTNVFREKPVVMLSSESLCKAEQLQIIPQNIPSQTNITYRTSEITNPQQLEGRTSIRLNQTGDYHLFISMETGTESKTIQKNVTVHERPDADFTYKAYGYQKITFESKSREGLNHQWIFGDGAVSKQTNPVHYYTAEGNYEAELVVKNEQQCEDTAEKKITIEPVPKPDIRDIFTPNGDGKNDVFKIKMKEPVYYHLVIKDQHGNRLFESHKPNEYWDGINNKTGEKEEEGKYIYQLQYKYKGQKSPTTKQGNLHLRYKR